MPVLRTFHHPDAPDTPLVTWRDGSWVTRTEHRYEYAEPVEMSATLKTVQEGEEEYGVKGGRYRVGPGRHLLIEEGHRYTSRVTSGRIVMCPAFFSRGLLSQAAVLAEGSGEEKALEGVEGSACFRTTLLPRHPALTEAAARLERLLRSPEALPSGPPLEPAYVLRLESALLELLGQVLDASGVLRARLAGIRAVKAVTREEIHRRLALAEDRMHAAFREEITLGGLARIAGMSPFHFLRRFHDCYGVTPHRYLTGVRLAHARTLLRQDLPIKQVALACGYRSVPSFVHLVGKSWGETPAAWRSARMS